MHLDFVKLHGCGNDFVFINDMERTIELSVQQVEHLCDRHFGIGADGVILVRPSQYDDCAAYMHYINSDGSLAEMCGNGVRCFAKYLVDTGIVNATDGSFIAETKAGKRPITFETDSEGKLQFATVDMGQPIMIPEDVPTTLEANDSYHGTPYVKESEVESPWGKFAFTCISMGNPHAVTFIDDFDVMPDSAFTDPTNKNMETFRLNEIGAFFEPHPVFPAKANIEFAQITEEGIRMRVYERGDGETLACGTGSCATNVAANLTGRAGRINDVLLSGGTLHLVWADNDHVIMTGPATKSFSGSVEV